MKHHAGRRAALVVTAVGTLALIAGAATGLVLPASEAPASALSPEPSAPAVPTLSPAQALLAATPDAAACAVTLAGDGGDGTITLETSGTRFAHLPIPRAAGRVFAGWYPDEATAAAHDVAARVNGADLVTCDAARELTLHASWMTPDEAAATATQVPILMYHQFTQKPEGEGGWLSANFYGVADWRADMTYIRDSGFYLPTWDELDAFIDGALWLPPRSVIITDDDADPTWLADAVPVVDELHVLTTSFVITAYRHDPTPSIWVQQRSHTNDMHTAGENGKGRMVNDTADQIAADLETSAAILGAKEVIAYPYGHYDDRSKQGVAQAGFAMAVTTEHGYVRPGSDKLALPRVRIDWGTTVADLASRIG